MAEYMNFIIIMKQPLFKRQEKKSSVEIFFPIELKT